MNTVILYKWENILLPTEPEVTHGGNEKAHFNTNYYSSGGKNNTKQNTNQKTQNQQLINKNQPNNKKEN